MRRHYFFECIVDQKGHFYFVNTTTVGIEECKTSEFSFTDGLLWVANVLTSGAATAVATWYVVAYFFYPAWVAESIGSESLKVWATVGFLVGAGSVIFATVRTVKRGAFMSLSMLAPLVLSILVLITQFMLVRF